MILQNKVIIGEVTSTRIKRQDKQILKKRPVAENDSFENDVFTRVNTAPGQKLYAGAGTSR